MQIRPRRPGVPGEESTANDDVRVEIGATLANALSSLAPDDDDSAANGRSIASFAHLLGLLLQDKQFFKCHIETLKDKVDEYLGFLQVPPSVLSEELPPWIPYILLVLETLLQHDAELASAHGAAVAAAPRESSAIRANDFHAPIA